MLERTGAKTALLITEGFRDVYEIGRVNRPDAYNLYFKKHKPLVERALRFEVKERMYAEGDVRTPLDETEIRHDHDRTRVVAKRLAEAPLGIGRSALRRVDPTEVVVAQRRVRVAAHQAFEFGSRIGRPPRLAEQCGEEKVGLLGLRGPVDDLAIGLHRLVVATAAGERAGEQHLRLDVARRVARAVFGLGEGGVEVALLHVEAREAPAQPGLLGIEAGRGLELGEGDVVVPVLQGDLAAQEV